ncbi:hypothetical protein NLG97_g5390 [Lecanicillium saksenae]|uniref:Uncharacterized protein n=1 Tax=Lecanicillium saksenae TaxID=468837 RepID=A0ACC1QV05_9HYPO|nr:hypothetical protein NLG97_g5390 [Lecanicillium saksenae]
MNRLDHASAMEAQLRAHAMMMAHRNSLDTSPEYAPALNDVVYYNITTENCPHGRVMSLLDMELAEDVDVSDATTAPGKLFKATIEYTSTLTGLVGINWMRSKQNVAISRFYKNGTTGHTSHYEPHDHAFPGPNIGVKKAARFLQSMEITVQADLDSNARLQFEHQVSATLSEVDMGACHELASGWIERDFPASRLPIAKEFIPARTESIYVIFFCESAEGDDIECKISELRERLDQAPVPLGVKKELSISPRMTLQGNYHPSTVEPTPAQPQIGTLASALQRSIRRSALNEKVEVATAHLAEYKCYPTDPYFVCQAELYKRHVAGYMALRRLGTPPDHVPVLPELYVVDIAWLKTRSSLDKVKRRVGKMLNYRIRQLVGYHSGFWVRVADSEHEFGVCTGIYIW